MSSFVEGQTVTRTVDGNKFTITSSGNIVTINGFPVTPADWEQVLSGKSAVLTSQRGKVLLSSQGTDVLFNGKSMTNGKEISTLVSFGSTLMSDGKGKGRFTHMFV